MGFNMADLAVTAVLEEKLEFLRNNPDHLNWMLGQFVRFPKINWMVGPNHIKQCVQYIMNVKPIVRPYYEMDLAKLPSIVMSSSQGESMQFMGDYGFESRQEMLKPLQIITIDVVSYDKNIVWIDRKTEEKLWPGLWISIGDFKSKIVSIFDKVDGVNVKMELADNVPVGTPLKDWIISTAKSEKWYTVNSSVDDVTTTITLTTMGEHGTHRLMSTVVRYCLKSSRMLFDDYGMQVARFIQQPIVLIDEEQMVWQTGFVMESKMADHWIEKEVNVDGGVLFDVDVIPDRG